MPNKHATGNIHCPTQTLCQSESPVKTVWHVVSVVRLPQGLLHDKTKGSASSLRRSRDLGGVQELAFHITAISPNRKQTSDEHSVFLYCLRIVIRLRLSQILF